MVKNPPANAGDPRDVVHPWLGKIPWRRKWQPTPVFWPGESHGRRIDREAWWATVGGVAESDMP